MIRRRRSTIAARAAWGAALPARLLALQAVAAAVTPRADRIIDLIDLGPGRRYVDVGCGTAAYAHLLAARAGADRPPLCLDLASAPGPVDAVAWPEKLPLQDASVDALTSLYFLRRFDDDVAHAFGAEIARVLAPGGAALVLDIAPVRNGLLNRLHGRLLAPGTTAVDLRGWGRLAALFSECGFDAIDLVNVGPFLLPPVPRVGVLLRRAPEP